METRKKTLERLSEHSKGMLRIGATGPGEAPAIEEALAGDLKNNAGQTNITREIPEDYKYDPAAMKPMAKMLWSMSVSLGHALSAHKAFVRLKSATISPDGMLGGRGYVMSIKDTRTMLHDACEALSALCDTIHDEINAPHWQPKLGQLEKEDVDKIRDLLSEAQGYFDDPEEMVKEDEEEVEKDGHAGWHHPAVDKANKGKKDPKSGLPEGGSKESGPQAQPLRHDMRKPNPQNEKTASTVSPYVRPTVTFPRPPITLAERVAAKFLQGNSSLPTETMPGGPRVQHLNRGDTDQKGPFGELNDPEPEVPKDDWGDSGGVSGTPMSENSGEGYNYPSDWDNDLHEKQGGADMALGYAFFPPDEADLATGLSAFMGQLFDQVKTADAWGTLGTSAFPDANTDGTPTEGFDFGIGDGNGDEARGQGAGGYGEGNPGAPDSNPGGGTGNMGVYGPSSGLPKDPGGQVNPDEGDSNLTIENEIGGKGRSAAIQFVAIDGDPWAVKNDIPGTRPFGAPEYQDAVHEEPAAPSPPPAREASETSPADKPWGQESVGWVMGLDPVTLVALGSTRRAWYDGVYDYEHPVEPVGGQTQQGQEQTQAFLDPGYTFSGNPLPGGPQEPFVGMFMEPDENFDYGGVLPGDGDAAGVARTDYFVDGPKPQNMDNVAPSNVGATKLPGEQMPAKLTPTTQRPSHNQEFMFGTGELPGDGTTVNQDYDRDLGPDQTTTYEQDNTPYIKWDDNTHEMRPDPIQQRDPVQGPYVHNDLTERPSNG